MKINVEAFLPCPICINGKYSTVLPKIVLDDRQDITEVYVSCRDCGERSKSLRCWNRNDWTHMRDQSSEPLVDIWNEHVTTLNSAKEIYNKALAHELKQEFPEAYVCAYDAANIVEASLWFEPSRSIYFSKAAWCAYYSGMLDEAQVMAEDCLEGRPAKSKEQEMYFLMKWITHTRKNPSEVLCKV